MLQCNQLNPKIDGQRHARVDASREDAGAILFLECLDQASGVVGWVAGKYSMGWRAAWQGS